MCGSLRQAGLLLVLLMLLDATHAFKLGGEREAVSQTPRGDGDGREGAIRPDRHSCRAAYDTVSAWAADKKRSRREYFPYGEADFEGIRRDERFFVDRTAYIRDFEAYPYQCFTRPPRWGKSLFLQILMRYYDNATTPDQWETWFGGARPLDIYKESTPLKGQFQVLQFDFSAAATGSVEDMNARLTGHINKVCVDFARKYGYDVTTDIVALATKAELILVNEKNAMSTLTTLARAVQARGEKLYLFIDEYDRFANHFLLGREEIDDAGYRAAVIDAALPIAQVFSTLKSLHAGRGLSRLFVTGLMRLAFRDASASNNLQLTSAEPGVGPALGFPFAEIERTVRMLELGEAGDERLRFEAEALELMKTYFNGYRFPGVDDDGLYCPQLCMTTFQELCDQANWKYLDENDATFWKALDAQELVAALGDKNSDPSRMALEMLAKQPKAVEALQDLAKGPVAFREVKLQERQRFGGLLTAGCELTDAHLALMYDQALVTLGKEKNTLVLPNEIARQLVSDTIVPAGKGVSNAKARARLREMWSSLKTWVGDAATCCRTLRGETWDALGFVSKRA